MRAVHHRQHVSCRQDASYIHPLEDRHRPWSLRGEHFILSRFMGGFSMATIVITWVAFTEINLQKHDLSDSRRIPFKYLNTMSVMHHNHHVKFTGGNYAANSLL